ncbi:MAG: GNAT family N-acetyltransferase [Myxococcales bacterium]|nr:GNAT family N-acetyltransferase [Myxococcales bacterium]MCB9525931.1 GNAT family N-acetyltransferase [Myxococcales bacterium]
MTHFETQRCVVRTLEAADLAAFHALQGDPEVMRHTGAPVATLAEDRASLARLAACGDDPQAPLRVWAAAPKAGGPLLGTVALVRHPAGLPELGYRLRRVCWGQGYGTELCAGLIGHGLQTLGLPGLRATVAAENTASVRILERLMAFEREAVDPSHGGVDRHYTVWP